MSEEPILISNINDFIFCPFSIYLHQLANNLDRLIYHQRAQIDGLAVHEKVDHQQYSTRKNIFQGIGVYCEQYNLLGKIDIFDLDRQLLVERKNKIKIIYDGYIFQLYAQYFSLTEMGYQIKKMCLYSYSDNKVYLVNLPSDNLAMRLKFEEVIKKMSTFDLTTFVPQNKNKCDHCVYIELCDRCFLK